MASKPKSVDGIPIECAYDELKPLEAVVPNPRNPNRHPEPQIALLAKVIQAQGWRSPITVSTRSGFVVRGHGRLEAARRFGATKVPVDLQDYADEASEWADLVADNRLSELAKLDYVALADLLGELDTGAIDMELTGFDAEQLEAMLAPVVPEEHAQYTFGQAIGENHQYVVLAFDNDFDWKVAQEAFGIETVARWDARPGYAHLGLGRVVDGAPVLQRLLGHE